MFIDELGRGYANENLYSSYFVFEDKVYRMEQFSYGSMEVREVGTDNPRNLPASVVTGWRTFKFPRLGWRKVNGEDAVWLSRHSRSYTRGLCYDNLDVRVSHGTSYGLDDDDVYAYRENNWDDIITQALLPVYDKPFKFRELLAGKGKTFVPSHDILIERVRVGDAFSEVYLHDKPIGKITNEGNVVANKANTAIIDKLVRKYAN